MKISASSFFEGVALAAGQSDLGTTASFKRDARNLARAFPGSRIEITAARGGIASPVIAADRWLTFRKNTPGGKLQGHVINFETPQYYDTEHMTIHFDCIKRVAETFPDESLAGVVAGTVVGLHALDLITTQDIDRQWGIVAPQYERYMSVYEANGVPREAANELFVLEWLDSMRDVVGFSFGTREPRWGSLKVLTIPEAAQVFVDDEEWGLSPAGNAVREGSHEVRATKDSLQSHDTANVAPAHHEVVNLTLK